jgi:hypothetical protein
VSPVTNPQGSLRFSLIDKTALDSRFCRTLAVIGVCLIRPTTLAAHALLTTCTQWAIVELSMVRLSAGSQRSNVFHQGSRMVAVSAALILASLAANL